jgi:hypothetical protein
MKLIAPVGWGLKFVVVASFIQLAFCLRYPEPVRLWWG